MAALLGVVSLLFPWGQAPAGEYDFAIPEAEKGPYELGGRLEARYIFHRLDSTSARYKLNYYGDDPGTCTHEWRPQAEFRGEFRRDIFSARLLTHHEYVHAHEGAEWVNKVYEGYVTVKPSAGSTLEAGKKTYLWGKGYGWNPAGFINRPKDPDDAGLSLEGFTAVGGEAIRSFSGGGIRNVAFTGLALPVLEGLGNDALGKRGDVDCAFKLYLLWHDTDLDFIFFDGPNQPDSYGFDFSKNLADNIELHGEAALRRGVRRTVIDRAGIAEVSTCDQFDFLVGMRYLTSRDTTFIVEYYHNGAGYNRGELEDFFAYQETAYTQWLASGDPAPMERVDLVTRPYYGRRTFGRDYAYLKITQKEPFDILYFSPWLAVIANLQDASANLQPGMTYTPVTNLEVNFRVGIPVGAAGTEFGEKQDVVRPELWVRYYF